MFRINKDIGELKEIKLSLSHEELAAMRNRNETLAKLKSEINQLEEKRAEFDRQI